MTIRNSEVAEAKTDSDRNEEGISRRTLLQGVGAGLLLTVLAEPVRGQWGRRGRDLPIAARVHLGADGSVTVMTGKVEGGQGARTELTQAAAEELQLPVERVDLIMGDTDLVPNDGITAASRTTPATVPAMRKGAAAARNLLIALAARKWNVDRSAVKVEDGAATAPGARGKLTYADLAAEEAENPSGPTAEALGQAIPDDVDLMPVEEWDVLGKSVHRPNGRDIVTGSYRYPSDVTRPGMLYGKVLRPPAHRARLVHVNPARAQKIEGVTVVQDGDFVGVAASTKHAARKGIEALEKAATWDSPGLPPSTGIYQYLREHARNTPQNPFADEVARAARSLSATYHTAYIAHAPLGPRAGVAEWKDDRVTVWLSTRNPFGCRSEIARAFGLSEDAVHVLVPDYGGGFGGNHSASAGLEAARLAKAVRRPVKVCWTRTEEFRFGYFRPAAVIDVEASLDDSGRITSWFFADINAGRSAINTPYRTGKDRCVSIRSNSPVAQGSYRALAATQNNFAREAFMDELAEAAGSDPLQFRLAHLDHDRLRTVLTTAAKRFGWKEARKSDKPGTGVGLACGDEKGAVVAACAEVEVREDEISVKRVCQVFECGAILNPENLRAQVEGCIIMGLGAVLGEEIRFDDKRLLNPRFSQYDVPRFPDVPELDVHLLDRPNAPSAGAGESPIIVIAPAVANAVYDAVGKRMRDLPMRLAGSEKT